MVRRMYGGLALLVLCLPAVLAAQGLYGGITGAVTDVSGAALVGASVVATHRDTNATRAAVTAVDGSYSFIDLPPGRYTVIVRFPGFNDQHTAAVPVTLNRTVHVTVVLQVSPLEQTVVVSSSPSALEADRAGLSTEFKADEIGSFPLSNYRNFQRLYDLIPGATPAVFQNSIIDTPGRALTTNVNGTARNSNNVRQDGAVNTFLWLPHHPAYVASAETIDTVSVSTSAFDAEQGMAGGAVVSVLTKSGTNELHGSAFAMRDDNRLKSNNFFVAPGFRQPPGSRNIFGGTAGGPIRRNRFFFFGSYEGVLERTSRFLRASVPTSALRNGNFAGTGTTIYDPYTGQRDGTERHPFAENQIPGPLIDPVARRLLELVPLPTEGGLTQNFFASGMQRLDRHQVDVKLTWNGGLRHHLWAKYGQMNALVHCDQQFGAAGGHGLCDSGYGDGHTAVKIGTLGHTWMVGANTVIASTFGWTHMNQSVTSSASRENIGLDMLGIAGTNGPAEYQRGTPAFFAGFSEFGDVLTWIPLWRNDRSYNLAINLSQQRGRHEFRLGAEVVRHELNHISPDIDNPRGVFRFGGGVTALNGGPAPTIYNQFAAFLLGLPTQTSKSAQIEEMTAREWQAALYLRDRWQVNRRLTVSYGVRIERYPLMRRADRGIETIDWRALTDETGVFVLLGGRGGNADDLELHVSYPAVVPRLGLAVKLSDRTVIRGGYGMTIDPLPLARPLRGFYPLVTAETFVSPNPYLPVGTIQDGIPQLGVPDANSGRLLLPTTAAIRSPAPDGIHRGYVHSWNATAEHQLAGGFLVSASYVGTATREAMLDLDINAAGAGEGQAGRPLAHFGRTATTTSWGLGSIAGCAKCGAADYHGLQVAASRPFGGGLMGRLAYTLSRAKNSFSGGPFGVADDVGWAGLAWNHPSVLDRNYALAGYDRTHVLAIAIAAQIPHPLRWRPGLAALAAGWQISGIFQAASGTPFTVTAPAESVNAPGNQQVPDRVSAPARTGPVRVDTPLYRPESWRPVTGVRFGNERRNSVRGPGFANVDLSISRELTLGGGRRVEPRLDVFNLFNSPRWENPSAANRDVTSPRFLQVTAATQAFDRQLRLGVRLTF